MSTGSGCNSLEELLCTIGVPSLSKPTFIEIERLIGASFANYLGELMLQAGLEEKQIAIQNNKFHQGVPAVTVIVDGGGPKEHMNTNTMLIQVLGSSLVLPQKSCCTSGT